MYHVSIIICDICEDSVNDTLIFPQVHSSEFIFSGSTFELTFTTREAHAYNECTFSNIEGKHFNFHYRLISVIDLIKNVSGLWK